MHDIPYSLSVGPEVCASMTAVCTTVRGLCPTLPLGIQILSAANKPAIAVALASGTTPATMFEYICSLFMHLRCMIICCHSKSHIIHGWVFCSSPTCCSISVFSSVAFLSGLDFMRAEGFVFSHVADEGLLNACAGDLLRYRRQIGAEHIQIFTDIKKKHRCAHEK